MDNQIYFIDKNNPENKYYMKIFEKNTNTSTNHETIIENAISLFFKWNKAQKPKIIISVTGGAKNFVLSNKVRTSFKEGISSISEKTHALIITGKHTKKLQNTLFGIFFLYRDTHVIRYVFVTQYKVTCQISF